jgi:ABC-type tungstate transport system permease subunit
VDATAPATLARAGEQQAYLLIDRPSWESLQNHYGLIELANRGPMLQISYGVLVVNDLKHGGANYRLGKMLADWLTGPQGRALIPQFRIKGKPMYFVR